MSENDTKDDRYPECYKTPEICLSCPSFGSECTQKVNELDYQRYIEENNMIEE